MITKYKMVHFGSKVYLPCRVFGRAASILASGCRYMLHLATSIRASTYRDKEFCSLTLSGRCTSSGSTFRSPFSKNRLLCRDPVDVPSRWLTLNACLMRRTTAFVAEGLFRGSSFQSWCANPVLALSLETPHGMMRLFISSKRRRSNAPPQRKHDTLQSARGSEGKRSALKSQIYEGNSGMGDTNDAAVCE